MPDTAAGIGLTATVNQGSFKVKLFFGKFLMRYLQKHVCALTFTHNAHNPVTTTEDIEFSVILK